MRSTLRAILSSAEASAERLAADLGAAPVGGIFARAADRHLHDAAASGATIIAASTPTMPSGLLLSRLPPKKKAKLPSMEIAPAIVAVIVMVSVSRFCTCASSCAITPATSS